MTTLRISRKKGPFADDPQVVGETVKQQLSCLRHQTFGETIIIYTTLETLFHLFEGVTVR